ncbi:MAG TPA: lysoplasmalogenase [Chitinophagaceae bacterium]|nr:lysoplasmalogenase [Chitinophagaceae bacterium]
MNRNLFAWLYLLVLAADLAALVLQRPVAAAFAKALLMPLLLAYFLACAGGTRSRLLLPVTVALVCSWAGDLLLIFEDRNPVFFLAGLAAFLLAQLAYIRVLAAILRQQGLRLRGIWIIPVLVYYVVLMWWLDPHLADLRWPVRVYGLVITTMLMLALHLLRPGWTQPAGRVLAAGAALFVSSDSLLALNKFVQAWPVAPLLIMLTYGLAEYGLTRGAIQYICRQSAPAPAADLTQ